MSVGLWPVFKPPQQAHPESDGAYLFSCLEELDRIAKDRGVSSVSSFGDNRPIPDDFDGHPDELEDVLGPFEEWFPVADGITTFSSLANALDDGAIAALFDHPGELQQDLREYAALFAKVEHEVVGFQLNPVF